MAEVFGTAASALAVVELAAKVISICAQYWKDVSSAREDIGQLEREATNLKNATESLRRLLDSPQGLKLRASRELCSALQEGQIELEKLEKDLVPNKAKTAMRRVGLRTLRWPFESKDIRKKVDTLQRYTQIISLAVEVNQTEIILGFDQKTVLSRLPIVHGAAFDSHAEEHNPTCLQDTRVDLLQDIQKWIQDPNSEAVFWLNGMAGTGKSTISRTLAHTASSGGYLGGSFFFKRGEGDRAGVSGFFSTLAAQLVSRKPAVAPHIQHALDTDPAVFGKAMREQFEKLLLEPLSKIAKETFKSPTLLIIVDALDECDREEDVKILITLLSSVKKLQCPRLKIFLTSRPELRIRLGFSAVSGAYQDLILHEVAKPVIERDIHVFLQNELTRIRNEYNPSVPEERHLPATWPKEADVQILVEMAVPLFIFAATVCRFISDRRVGNPNKNLGEVLKQQTRSQESKLDATYMPVLEQLIVGLSVRQREARLDQFRTAIGSIVVLANPLSASALARLLHMTLDDVLDNLDLLHSVLSVPVSSQEPIRLLHLSFRDFLLDPEKRENNVFWVNEKESHRRLAAECLRIMGDSLRENICAVQAPGTALSEIDPRRISKCLQPEMQYACRYWTYHLNESDIRIVDDDKVHKFLTCHFLHWLEALSLLGAAPDSLEILRTLTRIIDSDAGHKVYAFLNDAYRFIRATLSIVQLAPLQIYSSGLLFAPKHSIVRKTFYDNIPTWISQQPKTDDDWNNCQQTLEGHSSSVNSVAFSSNGLLVASASTDETVRIWSVTTGVCQNTLQGHTNNVNSVAFSSDGQLMASASTDQTVKIWSVITGSCQQTLEGHNSSVNSVAFSFNGLLVASASEDKTVRIWSVMTGVCQQVLEGHSSSVNSVVFSHNDQLVASGSYDKTVHIWSVMTGACQQILKGSGNGVESVTFSPDGQFVASAHNDCVVEIWSIMTGEKQRTLGGCRLVAFSPDGKLLASASQHNMVKFWLVATGEEQRTFKGHHDWVWSVAFSPDGQLMASASSDRTVKIWSVVTEEKQRTFEGHMNEVNSVVFSPEGQLVASTSMDNIMKLWSTATGECQQTIENQMNRATTVAFSPDTRLIVSASSDNIVRLWSVATGKKQQTLEGHSSVVTSVAFSPNGRLVASASWDGTARIWSATTGMCQRTLEEHKNNISVVVFSPDGQLLALGSNDGTIKIWSVATGNKQQTIQGHISNVTSVAFSPDSQLVASASWDTTIKLWSAATGVCWRTVSIGVDSRTLSFSSDGASVLTDVGLIDISSQLSTSQSQRGACRISYGISEDRSWITWRGKHLLWLPPDFRPCQSAICGSMIAIGRISGEVSFVQCAIEGWLPKV